MSAKPAAIAKFACAVLLGLVAAELYLHLTLLPEHEFCTWFTGKIHQPDAKYGFMFRPKYDGWMRHSDGVWNVPLKLDEHGFRLPAAESSADARRVLILGGESMVMCYGLPDAETLAARLADHTQSACHVQAVSLAGMDLYRSWHLYLDKLAATAPPPDLAVIAVYYLNRPEGYAWLPANLEDIPLPDGADELFHFHDGMVVKLDGPISYKLGRNLYRSILLHRVVGFVDHYLVKYGHLVAAVPPRASPPPDPEIAARSPAELGGERFVSLVLRIQQHFAARGAATLVVFLPKSEGPEDHYDALENILPPSVPRLNIHRQLAKSLAPGDYLAAGHYKAKSADMVSKALAPMVDRLLIEGVTSAESIADRKAPGSAGRDDARVVRDPRQSGTIIR